MITYALILLLTLSVAFAAVRLLRAFYSWNNSDARIVRLQSQSTESLSRGSGQRQADRQQDFVKVGKVPVRKPWGW